MSVKRKVIGSTARAFWALMKARPMNEEQLIFINQTLFGALKVELISEEEFGLLGGNMVEKIKEEEGDV